MQDTTPILVHGQRNKVALKKVDDMFTVCLLTMLQDMLHHKVPVSMPAKASGIFKDAIN